MANLAASAVNKIEAVGPTRVNPYKHIDSASDTEMSAAARKTANQLTESVNAAASALSEFDKVRRRSRYTEEADVSLLDKFRRQSALTTLTIACGDLQQSGKDFVEQTLCDKLESPRGEHKWPKGSAKPVVEALCLFSGTSV